MDTLAEKIFEKWRCCVRGDYQVPYVDFDSSSLYSPFASHEEIQISLVIAATEDLIIEEEDVANA